MLITTIDHASYTDVWYSLYFQGENQLYMSDGLLRDFMMQTADLNGDHKLSEYEIAWFYRHVVAYTAYVSEVYGSSFIAIADMDHDGLLDGDGKLLYSFELAVIATL